jgi:4-diphosphocytidyl-2-C-methyl-D-erythritol kinase
MVSFPPCKINLGLRVLDKRSDGYHNLETCFYPVPWTDILEVIKSDTFSFTTSGAPIPGDLADNLCVHAYRLLETDNDVEPVRIHLHKIIPAGAGLGGGSSDAAHTLRLLNEVCQLGLSRNDLIDFAAQLGSDCAFFVDDVPMIGTGRGEILSPISLPSIPEFLVLVNPGIHVSTAEAFTGIRSDASAPSVTECLTEAPASWKHVLKNDFEETVFMKYPSIEIIKEKLYALGATYASMSGSGSTVYGFFDEQPVLDDSFETGTVWCSWHKR